MARFELTDEQWAALQPLLPPEHSGRRGHPYKDHRTVLNGILWVVRTGAPWRDMPERYGSWKSCYDRLRRWERTGVWPRVLRCLQAHPPTGRDAQSAEGIGPVEWYVSVIDSTTVKAHPHAAGAPRKKGTKRRTKIAPARRSDAAEAA